MVWVGPVGGTGLTGRGPDSPAIGSDTPGLWWVRHSGFRSGFPGLGSSDTPRIRPDTPDFGLELHLGQTGLTGWVYRSDRC